jgi:outer membrane protein insertion porin family
VFRRDYNSFRFLNNNDRDTTYEQTTTGFQVRAGVPLTEFTSLALRYGLSLDNVSLDKNTYYFNGQCDPLLAGRYLCEAIGKRTTSSVGYSWVFDNLNNRIRPSAGHRIVFSQDFAGLGGSARYIRSTINAKKYWGLGKGFVFSVGGEGGWIKGLGQQVRLTDRFFLGEPQMRGFDIRGVGPRVVRTFYDVSVSPPVPQTGSNGRTDDALGGTKYYLGHLELELPLGSGGRELGLRPSIFVDAGALWGGRSPDLIDIGDFGTPPVAQFRDILNSAGQQQCIDSATSTLSPRPAGGCTGTTAPYGNTIPPFNEVYRGNSAKPRLSVGFGINWNSPFGPFRIDIAKALLKEPGDDTKLFSFNVGTQF